MKQTTLPKTSAILLTAAATLAMASSSQAALVLGEIQFNAGNVLPSPTTAISGDLLETSVISVVGENAAANSKASSCRPRDSSINPALLRSYPFW